VRKGDLKLISYFGQRDNGADQLVLYDLAKDISETTDLAQQQPEKVKELNGLISAFLASPLPAPRCWLSRLGGSEKRFHA
jgi:hypothetical protein